jgi:hypothetical protein
VKFGVLSAAQSVAIVRAMNAVVTAEGTVAPVLIEEECLAAAQRHLLGLDPPMKGLHRTLPDDLAQLLDTPQLRKSTVRLLATLSIVDKNVSAAKVDVVEEVAKRLGVREFGVQMMHNVARGRYRRDGVSLMTRFINHYWSYTGRASVRDWAAILWPFMPWMPGLRGYLRLDETSARYKALANLPSDTLGNAVYRYYATRGFPVPGDHQAIPEGWARHEVYHVIANYNTSLHGELLLAGFIGGNTDEMCLDLMLPALVQLHAGKTFVPGPTAEDLLKPDDFFRAVARGAAMKVDLLKGWRLWEFSTMRLADFRERVGIPAFTPDEHARLLADDGLLEA